MQLLLRKPSAIPSHDSSRYATVGGAVVGPFESEDARVGLEDILRRRKDLTVATARDVFEGRVQGDEIMLVDEEGLELGMHPFRALEDIAIEPDNGQVVFFGARSKIFVDAETLVLVQAAETCEPERTLPARRRIPTLLNLSAGRLVGSMRPHRDGGALVIIDQLTPNGTPRFLIAWQRDRRHGLDLPVISGHDTLAYAEARLAEAGRSFTPTKQQLDTRHRTKRRDYQRTAIYRLEGFLGSESEVPAVRYEAAEDAAPLIAEVYDDLALRNPPTVRMGRSTQYCSYWSPSSGVVLAPTDMTRWTVLHEIGHEISARIAKSEPGHGPTFAGVLLGLLARYEGLNLDHILAAARERDIDVNEDEARRIADPAPALAMTA